MSVAPAPWRALAAPAALLAGAWAVMWTVAPFSDTRITDVYVYQRDAALLAGGAAPYGNGFPFEYPPLALVPIGLPRALGGDYETVFGALMAACALATLLLVGRLGGTRAAWLFALAPLAAGAVLRTHFDLAVAALLAAALLALARERVETGFALLGLGAMLKGFPAVVALPAAAWSMAHLGARRTLRGLALFAAVVLAVSAPFLGHGYLDAYRFHLERPAQIESTPAVVLDALGGSRVTGTATTADAFNSNGRVGGAADAVQALFAGLAAAALALLTWLATRRAGPRQLVLCAGGAVLAFVALGKVLSPQYVAWLAPPAALLAVFRARAAAALIGAAIVLTQLEFPSRYQALVEGQFAPRAIVAARDAALVAALIATAAAAARWPRRGAAAPSSAPAPP